MTRPARETLVITCQVPDGCELWDCGTAAWTAPVEPGSRPPAPSDQAGDRRRRPLTTPRSASEPADA